MVLGSGNFRRIRYLSTAPSFLPRDFSASLKTAYVNESVALCICQRRIAHRELAAHRHHRRCRQLTYNER